MTYECAGWSWVRESVRYITHNSFAISVVLTFDNNEYKNIKILQQKFFLTENSILKEEAVYNIDLMLKNEVKAEAKVKVKIKIKIKIKAIKENISLTFLLNSMTSSL